MCVGGVICASILDIRSLYPLFAESMMAAAALPRGQVWHHISRSTEQAALMVHTPSDI